MDRFWYSTEENPTSVFLIGLEVTGFKTIGLFAFRVFGILPPDSEAIEGD